MMVRDVQKHAHDRERGNSNCFYTLQGSTSLPTQHETNLLALMITFLKPVADQLSTSL
uniref:Uncharacterized protein n=1 Tax=Arundo donax TaxID=35708 RepID=A0A0A9H783_ARUDO